MNSIDFNEDVEVGIKSISVEIPVRVEMLAVQGAGFDFTTSIDDAGQIILTPVVKEMEFISANTDSNVEFEVPVREQETIVTEHGVGTKKETSIVIVANLLTEADNILFSADVDEIGQCVISPLAKDAQFISASVEDSLNLVTESAEESESSEVEESPDVEATAVIEESVVDKESTEFSQEFLSALENAKQSKEGELVVNSLTEAEEALEVLKSDFDSVELIVKYRMLPKLNEALSEEDRLNIINKFMRGEIPLFSDNGKPKMFYTHLEELDSNGYSYYYDSESGCIVSYAE